ncbi:MAG: hypothetical protein E7656_06280 [Ruminococcaceae bacterium]|nr:hypothetical protein [Oscillospiraceae bacterium]
MKRLLLCLFLGFTLLFSACAHKHSFGDIKTTEPNCSLNGYKYRICSSCKEVEYIESISALGHKVDEYFNDIRFQTSYAYCTECGLRLSDGEYEPPAEIDRLYIYGVPEGSMIPVDVTYFDGETEYKIYGSISKDGNESNAYAKKDYDIYLFADSGRTEPFLMNPDAALSTYDKFALKSEYADKSASRNLTASALWSAVIATRDEIDKNLAILPGYGADAGFPVLFYTNNNYKGIYNLCKPNDETLFGIDDPETQAIIYTFPFFGTFDFRYQKSSDRYVPCQIIFPENEDAAEIAKQRFLDFCNFVLTSDDSTFKAQIGDMLDVDAAIDYLICIYAFGADSNIDLFCNWVTYDGKKWIPSMYNLTHTFGINESGEYLPAKDVVSPAVSEGKLLSGTDNALWEKLCRNFSDDIYERYRDLRKSVLNAENIKAVFEGNASKISDEIYLSEFDEYPEKHYFSGKYDAQSVYEWSQERFAILDAVLLK